jgi:hypothetical protein
MDHQALAGLLGNWGEFLGSIGVLATLIYLSLQIGQAKKATRSQIVQSATEQLNEVNRMIAADPTWATIISKSELTLDELSAEERTRFSFLELALMNGCESLFLHHTDGYVDPRVWQKWTGTLKAHTSSPGWQQWWREQPFGFSQPFVEFVDGLIEESIRSNEVSNWSGVTGPQDNG